jgi:hypothetical protein
LEDSDAPLSSLVMEFQIGGGIDEPVAWKITIKTYSDYARCPVLSYGVMIMQWTELK